MSELPDLLSDILLELHVPDFEIAKSFYIDFGFEVVWQKEEEANLGYLVMKRGKSILNFYGNNERVSDHAYFGRFPKDTGRGYGVEIIIPIDDIRSYYEDIKISHPESIVTELNNKYSHEDFRAVDPFGYYLRFVERYNWVDGRSKEGIVAE